MAKPIPANLLVKHPVLLFATGFGAGLSPKAPGTFGTLLAVPLYILISGFDPASYWITFMALFLLGIYVCKKAAELLKTHDHPGIVWDEIVGYLITMYSLPQHWTLVVAGFVLFRILDIFKPWPIKLIDKHIKGGLGIMLDDVVAGVTANVILQVGLVVLAYSGYVLR